MINPSFIMSENTEAQKNIPKITKEDGENVRIVFWGSECVSTVTSNMLILAAYLACRKGYRITLLETERQEICKKFPKKYGKYAHSYISTLIERQLYHVSVEEWHDRSAEERITMIKYLETNMDMVFVHMAERTDMEARSIMRNAHLLIMNMKQEWRSFDRYYAGYANLSANILLLIGDYYYDTGYGKEQLQEKYRICDGQLMVIPHNPRYEMVQIKGVLEKYMRHRRWRCRTNMQRRFYKEIGEIAERLCNGLYVSCRKQMIYHKCVLNNSMVLIKEDVVYE